MDSDWKWGTRYKPGDIVVCEWSKLLYTTNEADPDSMQHISKKSPMLVLSHPIVRYKYEDAHLIWKVLSEKGPGFIRFIIMGGKKQEYDCLLLIA